MYFIIFKNGKKHHNPTQTGNSFPLTHDSVPRDTNAIMKVEGPGKTDKNASSKKSGSLKSGDNAFGNMVGSAGTDKAAPTGMSNSITSIDALLAAQAAENPTEKAAKKRMISRAETLLDKLEDIRRGLLLGTITVGQMINVADTVAQHREKIMDPRLTALLDEIDLRAQIELAKMRKVSAP